MSALIAFQVHIMATACVDILLLYATVLNETLNAGDNPLKGREMQNRFWDRHFEGLHISFNEYTRI